MENLYLLTTKNLGDFYVVSSGPSEAEQLLYRTLEGYGNDIDGQVVNIAFLSKGIAPFDNELTPALFMKTNRLLLSSIWEKARLTSIILKFARWQFDLPCQLTIDEALVNDFFCQLKKGNIK